MYLGGLASIMQTPVSLRYKKGSSTSIPKLIFLNQSNKEYILLNPEMIARKKD
jgi:hypothetical protein